MFSHLILGLLRDGRARHGYELISEYRSLSGTTTNPGNFYRELNKLADTKLVETRDTSPGEDQRRIPYLITDLGRREFDAWLCSPTTPEEELSSWVLFADRVPSGVLSELLERTRDRLWLQGKTLERARMDALASARRNGGGRRYHPAPQLLLWHIKRVAADIEFLDEFRQELERILLSRPEG